MVKLPEPEAECNRQMTCWCSKSTSKKLLFDLFVWGGDTKLCPFYSAPVHRRSKGSPSHPSLCLPFWCRPASCLVPGRHLHDCDRQELDLNLVCHNKGGVEANAKPECQLESTTTSAAYVAYVASVAESHWEWHWPIILLASDSPPRLFRSL